MRQLIKKIYPPTIFYTLAISNIILWFVLPTENMFPFAINLLGMIPLVIGIVFNLWTDIQFKRNNTTVKPDEIPSTLIISGPFALSRHPMYLGMSLILFGEAILLGSLGSFLIPFLFIIIIEKFFIPFEERTLITWFPEEYSTYQKRKRKWI
jgi:protein-S-isoprenylcysteine O-methyltransferase Ste14